MGLTPAFQVVVGDSDITSLLAERLLSMTVTDQAGIRADTLEIRLDDENHVIEMPRPGVTLTVSLGYKETGLTSMGQFVVDEVEMAGPPNTVVLHGKAADMNYGLKEPKTRTWQHAGKSPARYLLSSILDKVASEHGLSPKLGQDFTTIDYDVVHQSNESDVQLLTRLARKLGAVAKPTNGYLVFVKRGSAKTASGKQLVPVTIEGNAITRWSMTMAEREAYQSVTGRYRDNNKADERKVKVGDGKPSYRLRTLFFDEQEAKEAAASQLAAFLQGKKTLEVEMPGDPFILAETPLTVAGIRDGVDGEWVVERAVHRLSDVGYSLTLSSMPNLG